MSYRYKHKSCWVWEGNDWREYKREELYDPVKFEHLSGVKDKFKDKHSYVRLKIVERESTGVRYFAEIATDINVVSHETDVSDQELHSAKIDMNLYMLQGTKHIYLSMNEDYLEESLIFNIAPDIVWHNDLGSSVYNFYPDIGGIPLSCLDNLENPLPFRKFNYVLIEVIRHGPPDDDKYKKLFRATKNHSDCIVLFDIITNENLHLSNKYFSFDGTKDCLYCHYYMIDGVMHEGKSPRENLRDSFSLEKHFKFLQEKEGFL